MAELAILVMVTFTTVQDKAGGSAKRAERSGGRRTAVVVGSSLTSTDQLQYHDSDVRISLALRAGSNSLSWSVDQPASQTCWRA